MARISASVLKWLLPLLMAVAVVRLWLMPLPSSFWLDEMETAFINHYGRAHPSLAAAPEMTETVYLWLPWAAEHLFGFSEIVYRLPSVLALGVALFLVARLAARLIHPNAAWFAAFACLTLRLFNYEAADARPYALGTCVAAASVWFLVRWLDDGRWRDALLFVVFAALLWHVHLVYWPFYLVYPLYAGVRLAYRETPVTPAAAAAVFAALCLVEIPLLFRAWGYLAEAKQHVIAAPPNMRALWRSLEPLLVLACGATALILTRMLRCRRDSPGPELSSLVLILGWWLIDPLALFAYSHWSGNSLFVPRYLSLALPGAALAATVAASYFVPANQWKPVAAVLGVGVLIFFGQWRQVWPPHHNSDWRAAARKLNELSDETTPVILPSPFVEARPPVWRPEYPLPGFLYCYLTVYPLHGRAYLFPFEDSPSADAYATALLRDRLPQAGRFFIYGDNRNVHFWREWLAARPELKGWRNRLLGPFADVDVAEFDAPAVRP